jgi:phage protein D
VKRFYARTNKIKIARGIAKQQRRERLLYKLRQKAAAQQAEGRLNHAEDSPSVGFAETESLPQCSPETRYQISNSRRQYWDITSWLHKNREDLAVKVSISLCGFQSI